MDQAFLSRMHADHAAALQALPDDLPGLHDIQALRAVVRSLGEKARREVPHDSSVQIEDHRIPRGEHPELLVRTYRPTEPEGATMPALFWIHGGGMVMGSLADSDVECFAFAQEVECLVASVEYRLAPEHPHPAPIEDCYSGLDWLLTNAHQLGVDPQRVAVGGHSAGGGLAASLALLARDRGGPPIAFQLLMSPMLDDRNSTSSSHYVTHPKVWNREKNIAAWRALLGDSPDDDHTLPYASAARATDLSDLPPAYIAVGDLELFLDEDVDYALRLMRAGVPAELHVYPGAFHASEILVPTSSLSRRWIEDQHAVLRRALHGVSSDDQ